MGLFAIGDLHFGFAVSKPMDIFGENWKNHSEKIIENWKREVTEEEMCIRDRSINCVKIKKKAKDAAATAVPAVPAADIAITDKKVCIHLLNKGRQDESPACFVLKNHCQKEKKGI